MARYQGKGIDGIRLETGRAYQVREGAGLDSGRVGMLLDPRAYSQDWIKRNEPGRYKPFEPGRECILRDPAGNVFTMFKSMLGEVGRVSFRAAWPK